MDSPSFLIDIDGVLYSGPKVIEGGPIALAFLRKQHAPFSLVTNTSRMSITDIEKHLNTIGYDVSRNEIITAPDVAVEYLSKRYGIASCFMIGDTSLDERFIRCGHRVTRREEPVDVVIVGLSFWPHFGEIDIARRLVTNGAEPLALNRDLTCPDGDLLRIGAGVVVAALESVISRPITLIGKPSVQFYETVMRRTGYRKEDTIMIGDSLDVDIAGASTAGLRSILVRTGTSSAEPISPECDWELSSIAELPRWYTENVCP